ncbi:MAG: hypothetical protein EOM00_12575 [Clostridia bacterium]|nr:hypothetical protein [Clostridia bacterium]
MFRIQHMAFKKNTDMHGDGVTLSEISAPRSLDEFDVNIIDLSSEYIWRYHDRQMKIDYESEFNDLNRMIEESCSSKIVIILPQNIRYKNSYGANGNGSKDYLISKEIKELIGYSFEEWIGYIVQIPSCMLMYENTVTKIKGFEYEAAFHFSNEYVYDPNCVLTHSNLSNKNTTINMRDVYLTTLKIDSYDKLVNYLNCIGVIQLEEPVPEWILAVSMFDDELQKGIVVEQENIISECNEKIVIAKDKLSLNMKYKSILYTNGDELVAVVFEILEKLLNCDLSTFIDEKKEDFLIKLEDITFIGEIKGVTSNIKSEHISQLDVHFQGYMDKLSEENEQENVKAILIMDHQRTQDIVNRQPVHVNQIRLAERNGSLIVETSALLKLFEYWLNHKFCGIKDF